MPLTCYINFTFGEAASFAPNATVSFKVTESVSKATTACPLSSKFLAMPRPMFPNPMKPTFWTTLEAVISYPFCVCYHGNKSAFTLTWELPSELSRKHFGRRRPVFIDRIRIEKPVFCCYVNERSKKTCQNAMGKFKVMARKTFYLRRTKIYSIESM